MPEKQGNESEKKKGPRASAQVKLDEFGKEVEKIATRTAESIKKVIDKALSARNTVLTIRVNDECNKKLSMLVEAGLFKSRSESAAFLIQEGIKSHEALFSKITDRMEKVEKIKRELKDIVQKEMGEESGK
ncbi:MAG: hypothetical protein ACE5LC_06515 [Candidatus Aminicenantales bacterium]